MTNETNSTKITNKLNEALSQAKDVLSENQINDIEMYIKAGEWGLALETLCDFLYEDDLPISLKAYNLLQEVGLILEIDRQNWEILKEQVVN